MRPSLGDRTKRCTPSVRPSVRHVPPIFSKKESYRNRHILCKYSAGQE